MRQPNRRRASSAIRALVVGAATLAITLVCFSIYDFAQDKPEPKAVSPKKRIPEVPTTIPHEVAPQKDAQGISISSGFDIGQGRDITLHLYAREGTKAVMEIAVENYTPVAGSTNEFHLTRPEIRMNAKDGRGINVTADSCVLEASRKGVGTLDPQRGHLDGNVVILIDRLSPDERAKLPDDQRATGAAEVVRIEADAIEFDLEYSKIIVPPGAFQVIANDINFTANGLEVRFDEGQNRIDYLRINDSARLELRAGSDRFGIKLPDNGSRPAQKTTLSSWLRDTLQQALSADQQASSEPEEPKPPQEEVVTDGVPTFQLGGDDEPEEDKKPDARYFVHIEQQVELQQLSGGVVQSRLLTDVLEIVRTFTQEGETPQPDEEGGKQAEQNKAPEPPVDGQVIVLTWEGRLTLEACADNDERCGPDAATIITAKGDPVELTSTEANATCQRMKYLPDADRVDLFGTAADPVVVRSKDQGTLTGVQISTRREQNDLHIDLVGPGRLVSTTTQTDQSTNAPLAIDSESDHIAFADKLHVRGKYIQETSFSFTEGVTWRERRVLERAVFSGGASLNEKRMHLDADTIVVDFDPSGNAGNKQSIKHLSAVGHVAVAEETGNMTCRELEISFARTSDGSSRPLRMTALSDVHAVQGTRTIKARDKLIVDFEQTQRPAKPFNAAKAYAKAKEAGLDITKIDWEAKRREQASQVEVVTGVSHLQAIGHVSVTDPAQNLDIKADRLDCDVTNGSEIQQADVWGTEREPAHVKLNRLTVIGKQVHLNVPDQWARVPGEGRMSFLSDKDLDGRQLGEPKPITIQWAEKMSYRGRENKATFEGRVHATSDTDTTFDSDRLLVEFDDVVEKRSGRRSTQDWWILQDLVDRVSAKGPSSTEGSRIDGLSKQPAYLLATGRVVVLTSEKDAETDRLVSRARIAGPRLSLDLRPDVSKLLIEGKGSLQMESFADAGQKSDQSENSKANKQDSAGGGLFALENENQPSKTLIEWQESMWYDFSVKQTQFQGDVSLRHFSGAELEKILGNKPSDDNAEGRRTFVDCQTLTANFDRETPSRSAPEERRMGGLTASGLSQFKATRNVTIQDKTEGLSLAADRVEYLRDRDLLAIYGTPNNKADIVIQRAGQFPRKMAVERCFYNLKTGSVEISKTTFSGR